MRAKKIYSCAVLLTIILGLGSRVFADRLPEVISSHFGDAMWAAMVYFAARVLLTRRKPGLALLLSLGFNYGIEFSQLYQSEWVNGLRDTVPGGLILGKGFLRIDLLRYTAGILIAYALDRIYVQWGWNKKE